MHARFVHNTRLVDALTRQAQGALTGSAGARAYYDRQRARGVGHQAALRQLANRLVGILHGCLRARAAYDEANAWAYQVDAVGSDTTVGSDGTRLLARDGLTA
ncbi:MAG: IS110 family transposase [Pseudonocardia sp. 73-21]|nr:MAG: IS110 family transposase [Pseudonocardia sp. 73-21]